MSLCMHLWVLQMPWRHSGFHLGASWLRSPLEAACRMNQLCLGRAAPCFWFSWAKMLMRSILLSWVGLLKASPDPCAICGLPDPSHGSITCKDGPIHSSDFETRQRERSIKSFWKKTLWGQLQDFYYCLFVQSREMCVPILCKNSMVRIQYCVHIDTIIFKVQILSIALMPEKGTGIFHVYMEKLVQLK